MKIMQWTWGFFQSFVGYVLYKKLSAKERLFVQESKAGSLLIRTTLLGCGLSFGRFVFSYDYKEGESDKQKRMDEHELGHAYQSLILGPLYLFIIGAPSIIWLKCFEKYRQKRNKNYYSFWTERWADKIVKVDRKIGGVNV